MDTTPHPLSEFTLTATRGGAKAKPCGDCGGSGYEDYMIYVGYDFNGDVGQRNCGTCQGHGIEAIAITIPAPTIKPVRKRKTGKMYTRNPMLNANDRDHWRVTRPITAQWRGLGLKAGRASDVKALGMQHARIDAYIHRPIANRSDAGNFYPTVKPIIDGLVEAGLLPDDNDNHLDGPYLHKGDKGPYAVTLIITETERTEPEPQTRWVFEETEPE